MSIDPKIITVFLDASPSGRKRVAHAASLAQRWNAHLIGVYATFSGVTLPPYMSYARGEKAIVDVIAYEDQLDADAEAAAARVSEDFQTLCARLNVPGEFHAIGRENSIEEAIRIAFHSDLILVGHPEPHGLPDYLSAEQLLLQSGMPLLIVPNEWEGQTIGNKILIGWNATRQVRRAVADAMALLVAAQSVTVLVIDPRRGQQHGQDPGSDIALHLDRHGAHVHLEQVPSLGDSIPAILLSYAEHNASDLLVVGAYSHARLKEVILGGTTRTLLENMPIPTLMSRRVYIDDCLGRQAKDACGLSSGHPFIINQCHRCPLIRGQTTDSAGDSGAAFVRFQHLVCVHLGVHRVEVVGNRFGLHAPSVIDAKIHHDPVEPG